MCEELFPSLVFAVAQLPPAAWALPSREVPSTEGEADEETSLLLLLRHGSMGYHLRGSVGRGAFGEVWRAQREPGAEAHGATRDAGDLSSSPLSLFPLA